MHACMHVRMTNTNQHLLHELARGRQDKPPRVRATPVARVARAALEDHGDHRKEEGSSLAGARLGARHDVEVGAEHRERVLLLARPGC